MLRVNCVPGNGHVEMHVVLMCWWHSNLALRRVNGVRGSCAIQRCENFVLMSSCHASLARTACKLRSGQLSHAEMRKFCVDVFLRAKVCVESSCARACCIT